MFEMEQAPEIILAFCSSKLKFTQMSIYPKRMAYA